MNQMDDGMNYSTPVMLYRLQISVIVWGCLAQANARLILLRIEQKEFEEQQNDMLQTYGIINMNCFSKTFALKTSLKIYLLTIHTDEI